MSIFYIFMSIPALYALLTIAEALGKIAEYIPMLYRQLRRIGNALEFLAYQENEEQPCNVSAD